MQNIIFQNLQYYTFFIDANNIEEKGFYLIVHNKYSNDVLFLRDKLKESLVEKKVFFPYNFSFNHQIKFGLYFSECEKFFISIQPIIKNIRYDEGASISFIKYLINHIGLTLEEIAMFYFYKTVNNDHCLTINEIAEKEKYYNSSLKKTLPSLIENNEDLYSIDFDFINQKKMPKYFRLQVFDRVLSMFFFKDSKKLSISELVRNSNSRYV